MMNINRSRSLFIIISILLLGCGDSSSHNDNVVLYWNNVLLNTISSTRLGPPMTARALAIVHTCIFDAWAAYDSRAVGTQLGSSLRRPGGEHTVENKRTAISYAAFKALSDLYPAEQQTFVAAMEELGYSAPDDSTDTTSAAGVGNVACAAVLDYRHQDGSNQLGDRAPGAYSDYTNYRPVNTPDQVSDPSRWQPLRFANGATPGFIAPHWNKVVPFGLSSPAELRTPPPRFGSQQYLEELQELVDIYKTLSEREKVIAEYWADGPRTVLPPGHWQLFAQEISRRDNHTVDDDVKLFFILGNGVLDASIAAWDMKRAYDTSRPITAIRHFYAGKSVTSFLGPGRGFGEIDGREWLPYQSPNFITPPFSEYISGHSTFSAASAELLRRFTGSDRFGLSVTIKANSSTIDPGVPARDTTLSWGTFTEAADEAGISRLYGGIHFRSGDLTGRATGRMVAERVWQRAQEFISGSAEG